MACDLLGCQYPIVLAGMGGVSRSELVTAVIEAGGYGFLGMVRETPELIRSEIQKVKANTDAEFGVNIIPAATDQQLLLQQVHMLIKEQVASVCLFWDIYPDVIKTLRDAGILVVHQVGTEQDADAALTAGAHMLIAQGVEAGGHVRGSLSVKELLPRVLRIAEVPVLAAGGIVDGRDLADQLQRGADGVVVGTAFLASKESFANDYHKRKIINLKQDETILTGLFHINWPHGAQTRVIPNSVTREATMNVQVDSQPRVVIGKEGQRPVYLRSTDSPLRNTVGDLEAMPIYAGCGAYRVNRIEPAATILNRMVTEAKQRLFTGTNDTGSWCGDDIEMYSSPCFQGQTASEVMPASHEIIPVLKELLAAERAGARVTIRSMLDCRDTKYREVFQSIYQDEVRWCEMLATWLYRMGQTPSRRVGNFYEKAIKIRDLEERIGFLNKGQAWVVKKIKQLAITNSNTALQEDLNDMLINHVANIKMANKSAHV